MSSNSNSSLRERLNVGFAPPRETASRTRTVVTDNPRVFVAVSLAYLTAYLFVIGDLSLAPGGGFTVGVADLSNSFRRTSGFYFEPVASVAAGDLYLLLSPGNLLIGGSVAALVGANLVFSYVSISEPACETHNRVGMLSAVPALTAGTACCAPTVFLALGVQASAGLLAVQSLALPFSVALLLVSLSMVASRVTV
jgi:hypothetical protein